MNIDQALSLAVLFMKTAVLVGSPLLMASLVAGVLVGVFQAATQINEASVSFVVKVVALTMVAMATAPALGAEMVRYTRKNLEDVAYVGRP